MKLVLASRNQKKIAELMPDQFFGEMGVSKTLLVQIGRWESGVNVSCGCGWLGSSEVCRK